MQLLSTLLIILVAVLHAWFLILEMFLWQKPLGRKIFHLNVDFAKASAVLASNQGLYNGFLCAGLLWSVLANNPETALQLKIFFLSCVAIAGIYGACTLKNRRVFFIQALPAIIALVLVMLT